MDHQHDHCSGVGGVYQSLDELNFGKGPWMPALNGDYPAIQKYLETGGEPNVADPSGYTPLHYAARSGCFNICKELLQAGANVNMATRAGKSTPLHRAAYTGYPSVVKLLLDHNADPKAVDDDGKTPLHKAAEGNSAEAARILIKYAPQTQNVLDKRVRYPKDYVECTEEQAETYKALHWIHDET